MKRLQANARLRKQMFDRAPRSLGVVSQQNATTVLRTALLKDTAAFALTVEPPGGSPSGKPTGPIVSVGKLQL